MRKNDESLKTKKTAPLAFLLHCMIGIIVCLALSFIFSLLISGEKLPASSISVISCVSAFVGAGTASVLSAKKFGRTLLTSLAQGILYFAVLYLVGAALFSRMVPSEMTPAIPLSCFLGAFLGAIIAALFKRRRH